MYMPGRLRTASSPSRTWISLASYFSVTAGFFSGVFSKVIPSIILSFQSPCLPGDFPFPFLPLFPCGRTAKKARQNRDFSFPNTFLLYHKTRCLYNVFWRISFFLMGFFEKGQKWVERKPLRPF